MLDFDLPDCPELAFMVLSAKIRETLTACFADLFYLDLLHEIKCSDLVPCGDLPACG